MNGTGEHYSKWNKPGGGGQIPYDLTFNWSLINKRKKQAKYTRDIEIKNNLTVTGREEGGDNGDKGGRDFKNNYKGHMDKTKVGCNQGREVGMAVVEREW